MTITFEDVKNSNPLLIIYPAGTGGEFITGVLSQSSESFHNLVTYHNTELNRYSVICPLDYSSNWSDLDDPYTWVNYRNVSTFSNRRFILKDHPIMDHVQVYYKYLPNIPVIYMTPFKEFDYFGKLIFIKTAKLCTGVIDDSFIKTAIGNNLTDARMKCLLEWANNNQQFWLHELYIANTTLSEGKDITNFRHIPDLAEHIKLHTGSIKHSFNFTLPKYCYYFPKTKLLNCDSLRTDGVEFWKDMKNIVEDIDMDFALEKTAEWISKNNKLVNEHDNTN